MDILKLIICNIILLTVVAAIMLVCSVWNARVFIAYVAVVAIALAIAACIWPYD